MSPYRPSQVFFAWKQVVKEAFSEKWGGSRDLNDEKELEKEMSREE